MPAEWSLPAAFDVVAAAVPDRDVLVCEHDPPHLRGGRGADARARPRSSPRTGSARTASAPSSNAGSAGSRRSRCVLHNCAEYVEAMLGCYRARAVPFNVNHHYQPHEVRAVLDMFGDRSGDLPPRARPARRGGARRPRRRCSSRSTTRRTRPDSRARPASRTPSPRPRRMVRCPSRRPTTSTSCAPAAPPGSPKGVLWRQGDIFVAGMGGSEDATAEIARRDRRTRARASGTRRRRSCTRPRSGPRSPGSTAAARS